MQNDSIHNLMSFRTVVRVFFSPFQIATTDPIRFRSKNSLYFVTWGQQDREEKKQHTILSMHTVI